MSGIGVNVDIVALGRAPSLVIDAQLISDNDLCAICDSNVLIYSLVPNVKHKDFINDYHCISNEIKKYSFDTSIYNGLVFKDKQEIDKEEEEYFKTIEDNEFKFNLIISTNIPTNSNLSFILPSTFGQGTLFGGISGLYTQLFKKLNKELHKTKDELSAYISIALDLMSQAQESEGNNQTSISDVAWLVHSIYHNELQNKQKSIQPEGPNRIILNNDSSNNQMSNWKHNAILMSACSSTDYNMLQCMPETKPFVLLSRYGYCRCAVPVRYDQTQFRDLGMRTFSSATSATNFGHRWTSPQTQLFPLYDEYEGNTYRKYVQMEIEEELGENGTLPLSPQYPVLRYHIPVYPLRFGKFINAQMLFGSSQLPLQAENLKWKTLEPWQIRKAVTMMGAEGDVRQRWQLSERQRVRKQLSLQSADDENSDQNQISALNQQEKDEQKKNLILLLKEIRNKEYEDETMKRFNQLQFDVKEINQQLINTSDQTFKVISQPQLSLLKRKVKLLATNIYPEITSSSAELTIHQPTIMQLQEQTSPQYQKQNIVLNTLSIDTLEHPITLNSIHHAELQDRLQKIPKEYL